jgi:hypothetical protein
LSNKSLASGVIFFCVVTNKKPKKEEEEEEEEEGAKRAINKNGRFRVSFL